MNTPKSYFYIILAALVGGVLALLLPGIGVGSGIAIGVAIGIAAVYENHHGGGLCRHQRRRQSR